MKAERYTENIQSEVEWTYLQFSNSCLLKGYWLMQPIEKIFRFRPEQPFTLYWKNSTMMISSLKSISFGPPPRRLSADARIYSHFEMSSIIHVTPCFLGVLYKSSYVLLSNLTKSSDSISVESGKKFDWKRLKRCGGGTYVEQANSNFQKQIMIYWNNNPCFLHFVF